MGGILMICKGCAEANNKFLKSYDDNKPTSYIIYLDANNLHGHSMKQLLPTKILDCGDLNDFSLDHYSSDSLIGCFLDVELHDLYNDYSLAGEKIKLT